MAAMTPFEWVSAGFALAAVLCGLAGAVICFWVCVVLTILFYGASVGA